MNDLPTNTEAIRSVLFRKAETLNQRLLERSTQIADHLGNRDDRAVLGALDGMEATVASIRTLMSLARDCFPPANSKEGV